MNMAPNVSNTAVKDPVLNRFRKEVSDMIADGNTYAVLDGAHFDDLQDELLKVNISSRSLFLSGGDNQWRRDGPWLVALSDRRVNAHIMDLTLEKPCAVFWSCPSGETALYKHLRSINRILVPDDRIEQNLATPLTRVIYERVLFRHWDPNVMGALLPSFTEAQFSRVLGPAKAITMNATKYGGIKRLSNPGSFPPAPKGPLKITTTEIGKTNDLMGEATVTRISNYLRKVAPYQTAKMDNFELSKATQQYIKDGREYGVKSEAALARWSYMQVVTSGKLTQNPDVYKVMTAKDPTVSADRRVQILLQASIKHAEEKR